MKVSRMNNDFIIFNLLIKILSGFFIKKSLYKGICDIIC